MSASESKRIKGVSGGISAQLHHLLRVRQLAVPSWMIERAGEQREAGNWHAACRIARVEPSVDLTDVARKHGSASAELVEDTLKHFAPDLLRWHISRSEGSIVPGRTISLMTFGRPLQSKPVPALAVITPRTQVSPQKLRLVVTTIQAKSPFDLDLARDLWDVRHAPRFIERCGDGAQLAFRSTLNDGAHLTATSNFETITRLQDQNDYTAVWQSAGFGPVTLSPRAEFPPLEWWSVTFSRLKAEAQKVVSIRRGVSFPAHKSTCARISFQRAWPRGNLVLLDVLNTDEALAIVEEDPYSSAPSPQVRALATRDIVELPEASWRRPPDVDLLRFGLISPEELHPLVHRALFPELSALTECRIPTILGMPRGFRVRCGDAWHRVVPRDGKFHAVEHPPEQQARELVMAALGGKLPGCFRALRALYDGKGRLPKELRLQLRDFHLLLLHGDLPAVDAFVRAVLGYTFRSREGKTLLHQLSFLGTEYLPRLLEAGLDINSLDNQSRTPLHDAVLADGDRSLIEALLHAGADPHIRALSGLTPGDLAHKLGRQDLAFLPTSKNGKT